MISSVLLLILLHLFTQLTQRSGSPAWLCVCVRCTAGVGFFHVALCGCAVFIQFIIFVFVLTWNSICFLLG